MKLKQNSFNKYLNYCKRPSSYMKFKKPLAIPSSLISNRKLHNQYHSPDKENEILLIKQKFLNNKNKYKFQSSYFTFLAPILNLKKKSEVSSNISNKNNLILTSIDNSSVAKPKDKIFPYEYNNKSKKKIINHNNAISKKNNIYNLSKNNISLANFLSMNKRKKTKKKKIKHITPDSKSNNKNGNKVSSKLNTEKRNNKRTKNYFTSSLRTRKNSRGWSDKGKERDKGRENLMKKLNILDFKKLAKPHSNIVNSECFTFKGSSNHYGYGLTYDSNRKNKKPNFQMNKNKNKYGVNHFMDYLRGARIFKCNKKTNKSISISSMGNISYKKVLNNNNNNNYNCNCNSINKIKSPVNVNHSCTAPTNNLSYNSKISKNSIICSIKNLSSVHGKKNKKLSSKEHKKTKSINIGPMSYPCFNCFFNIINDNGNNNNNNNNSNNINNIKSKLNNITIDMNYGRSKKKIIFFYDKNNFGHKQKNDTSNTMIDNNNNYINNNKNNLYSTNINKKQNSNNIVSNYYININNQIDNHHNINNNLNIKKNNKKINSNLIKQKFNKIISQSQQDLVPMPKTKKKNFTTKNSPSKMLSQRISTDNNTKGIKKNMDNKNNEKNRENKRINVNVKKSNKINKSSKPKKAESQKESKEKNLNKTAKNNHKNIKKNDTKKEDNLENNKIRSAKLDNSEKIEKNLENSLSSKSSGIQDYNYYMRQSNKLANYIKNYYKKYNVYPPTKINFYKYGRLIGQGAFGKVNIGLNVLSGRVVAIKSFNKDKLTINSENMKKIMYETNLMQKLNHPNITKILEMFEDDKYILIIMEYINGGNLFSFVKKRRKLSEKIAKFLFKQIILGIKHIHSKNIVHRDIKLENILIDLNNRVKICDFGIGVILRSEDELLYDQCGTPMYMAPEIILSSKKKGYKGFPVDIWSSGIALYIMLSGTLPFNIKNKSKKERKNMKNSGNSENGENYEENDDISLSNNNNYELQYSIINKNPKTIEKISDEARDILRGLLNKDPDKRLTIDEILNHPWLKSEENDYNYNKNKYKLFTKAEMIMLSKNYIDYRIKGNDDLKETFTLSNLNDDSNEDNKNKNIKTKSSLLAPYNTLIENESCRINEDGDVEFDNGELFSDFNNSKIQLENEIIKMGNKVKQLYINYELNNNGELDNGMIIQSKSKSNTFNLSINDSDTNGNHSGDENIKFEDFRKNEEKKKTKILDIIENLGYDKKYVLDCVENNKLCHASSVYYLLMNYENI